MRYGARINPVRDWLMLLSFSAIILAGIIVWNIWVFDTVANGGVLGAPAASTSSLFSNSSIDTIRTIFADRAVEEAKYKTGTYHFIDPSQ